MIDDGLPDSREGWPDGVLDAIGKVLLGDVVDGPPIFYFAEPNVPVWEATRHAQIDEADVVVFDGVSRGLITSQTCDIGEEDADPPMKPFVMVAPVYDAADILDGATRSLLKSGRGPAHLVHLPALEPGFWVADLRIELPVEKGWLAGQTPTKGFGSEQSQRALGARLARIRSRPAFARVFGELIHRPLIDALKALKSNDRELWEHLLGNVNEVRAALDSLLSPSTVRLLILNDEPIPADIEEWFRTWWDEIHLAAAAQGLTLLAMRFGSYDDISAAEYLATSEVDLSRVSPR